MMDIEREARELFAHRVMTDWGNEDPTGKRREIFIGHLIQDITSLCTRVRAEALEEAAKAVSGFDNGCGCCADKDAPSVIHALKTPGRKETA